jgi:Purple acid Phosphatase, N-terminal domain/Calcineurin-like phosphoesterase
MSSGRFTRRQVLQSGVALSGGVMLWRQPAIAAAPVVEQVHLQFGADAARSMVVSWATPASVRRPRVRYGPATGDLGEPVAAATRSYVDAASGTETWTHHASLLRLAPATTYVYEVWHDGASPVRSTFRTAPAGRAPFRFTSFGDQTTADPRDPIASPFASLVVDRVEAQEPLFHLVNGDLCYANFNGYTHGANPFGPRPDIWRRWFLNNQRSAARRAWMPAAGNHENEAGNGPQGFSSYATRFSLPGNGSREFENYWYAFRAGSVQVVVLQNDDVCYQDGGNTYIRGYSRGMQRAWLDRELAAARADRSIDWVVVCMHQLALSSSADGNGCDLGIREEFVPLFDRYGVDLVLCGHDHDYERSFPVRGVVAGSPTRRPRVVSTDASVIDTALGTVHLTLGGGGTALPTNLFSGSVPGDGQATVVTGRSTSAKEPSDWSAVRDDAYPYGFAAIDVDPGHVPGGQTTLTVTYYRTPPSALAPDVVFDRFVLRRNRSDHPVAGRRREEVPA